MNEDSLQTETFAFIKHHNLGTPTNDRVQKVTINAILITDNAFSVKSARVDIKTDIFQTSLKNKQYDLVRRLRPT